MKISPKILLLGIFLLAGIFRLYNINWDQGNHLHPDERAIVMTVDKLKFPQSLTEFLSPASTWNPHFFAYGSFPMYLLRITGDSLGLIDPSFAQYDAITLVGRFISTLADIFTVFILFMLGKKLFDDKVGLLAAFFYSISVLPIQLSHFFAVDTILTCFVIATLYSLLAFYEKPTVKKSLFVGLFFGLSLATKVSALVLLASIVLALVVDFVLIFLKIPHHPKRWLPHLPNSLKHLFKFGIIICFITVAVLVLLEPYALIDFKAFWLQTLQQSTLTNNPFYFPYTLQFVGKTPYIYELRNVFFWGLGPFISTLSFTGLIYLITQLFNDRKNPRFAKAIILLAFFLGYFFVVGKFAVGFMRYMLPVYPLFALSAGVLFCKLIYSIKSTNLRITLGYLLLAACLIWPLSFMHIYQKNNTRTDATNWINQNIPRGSTLAIEHWDDSLPMQGQENYNMLTLPLYDIDNDQKWILINQQLEDADYVILASNRLSGPIRRLTDCSKLPPDRCYTKASAYYKNLLDENLGFTKVAEFTNYPTIPILNIPIVDENADESFSVIDHPKVMIFQKTPSHSTM